MRLVGVQTPPDLAADSPLFVPESAARLAFNGATGGTQLQPLVLPQLGQAWHEPARFICTPHCMHIGASD